MTPLRNLLTGFFLFFSLEIISASECYHYHTSRKVEIIHAKDSTFLQISIIDPNGISIASRERFPIPEALPQLELVDLSGEFHVAGDGVHYYFVNEEHYSGPVTLLKIGKKDAIRSFFSTGLACIDGKWQQLFPDFYKNELSTKTLENFPDRPEIIAQYRDRSYVLKSGNDLYTFYPGDSELIKVKGISADNLDWVLYSDGIQEGCFLTDGNTFLQIKFPWLEVIPENKTLEKAGLVRPFTIQGIEKPYISQILEINDHLFEISGDDFKEMKGISWYNDHSVLLKKNGQPYLDPWAARFNQPGVDISEVHAFANLHGNQFNYYSDDFFYYYYHPDKHKFFPFPGLTADYHLKRGVFSYMHGSSSFYDNGREICYLNHHAHEIAERIAHSTPLKNLKIGYAFDDKLLIEDVVVKHSADYGSLTFLGSTVDVISGCDGGEGQIPIEIAYNYFFKDKKHVYFYRTGSKTLHMIPDNILKFVEVDDADHLSYEEMNALISML